jgi:hypothetical protein
MSMARDYISDLRAPTGMVFIQKLIYEHEEPQWNDTDRKDQRTLRENPVPMTICLLKIPHELSMARSLTSAVRGQRLIS